METGPYFDFTGKHVLITGASRGIGFGVAEGFAKAGADLTIVAVDSDVNEACTRLKTLSDKRVAAWQCDITEPAQLDELFNEMKRIDVLINNAGLELITPIAAVDSEVEDIFGRIIDINVMGTYLVTRRALSLIPDGGRIIVTSSMWGKTAVGEFSAYCTSKHANLGFVRSLAKELGPRNISVNAVCPGWVRTQASMRTLNIMAKRSERLEQDLLDEILAAQALPGLMEPGDMAATYMFLASDAACNITGQAWTVDRGEILV